MHSQYPAIDTRKKSLGWCQFPLKKLIDLKLLSSYPRSNMGSSLKSLNPSANSCRSYNVSRKDIQMTREALLGEKFPYSSGRIPSCQINLKSFFKLICNMKYFVKLICILKYEKLGYIYL